MKSKRMFEEDEEERLLLRCQDAIANAIQRSGLTRSQIAKRLGKDRSFVTQALSRGRNPTLRSLTDLAWAAGFRIQLYIRPIPDRSALKGEGG